MDTYSSASASPIIGRAATGLLQYLVDQQVIPASGRETLVEESVAILRGCMELERSVPRGSKERAVHTALVCGYVQSGKTVSIEMVSALGKDNGYRIIVLLAGVTTNLVGQSVGRMEHLRAGAGAYDWVMLTNPREGERSQLESPLQEWRHQDQDPDDSRTVLITVMKNVSHLRPLAKLLKSLSLRGIPALIFDDEADQASLNTRPRDPHPSPVYGAIEELREALPNHTLLQYTATPQAPLLISRIDSLSADFAELVSPGEGYAGGHMFFKQRPELVETIPGVDIFDYPNLPHEAPQSLIAALQIFFVGVAARLVQGSPTGSQNRSMLIHPHQRREVHNAYLKWVRPFQSDWVQTLSRPTDPDRAALLAEFEKAHCDLARTVNDLPPFTEIAKHLAAAVGRSIPTLVNSDNGREIPWANHYAHILVGGEKLSRGYTVKGLTVTYMPRSPGGWTADTLQQRARFFGYHAKPVGGYLDYCRIYLHKEVRDAYEAYIAHEEDMREQIRHHRGKSLKDLKRTFFLDSQLRATRRNVLLQLYKRPLFKAGWFEQKAPHAAPDGGAQNAKLIDGLSKGLTLEADESHRHQYADVVLLDVLERLLVPFACPDDRDETPMSAIRLILGNEALRVDAPPCRVIFIDRLESELRERTVRGGTIDLLQGRSSSQKKSERYPGDRHLKINEDDRVTIQIHNIRILTSVRGYSGKPAKKAAPTGTPALAIYLPKHVIKDVIVQKNN